MTAFPAPGPARPSGGGGQHQEPDARLNEPPVDAGQEETECQKRQPNAPRTARWILLGKRVPEGPQGHGDHEEGQDLAKGGISDGKSEDGARDGSQAGGKSRPEDGLPVHQTVAVESPDGAHVLEEDPHPVGAVGDAGRKAHEDENRQRQEGASSGDDVQGAGDDTGQDQQGIQPRIGHDAPS